MENEDNSAPLAPTPVSEDFLKNIDKESLKLSEENSIIYKDDKDFLLRYGWVIGHNLIIIECLNTKIISNKKEMFRQCFSSDQFFDDQKDEILDMKTFLRMNLLYSSPKIKIYKNNENDENDENELKLNIFVKTKKDGKEKIKTYILKKTICYDEKFFNENIKKKIEQFEKKIEEKKKEFEEENKNLKNKNEELKNELKKIKENNDKLEKNNEALTKDLEKLEETQKLSIDYMLKNIDDKL